MKKKAGIDVSGQRFGRLVAIRHVETCHDGAHWLFKCDCGNDYKRRLSIVRFGSVKSCGCGQLDGMNKARVKHGRCGSAEHRVWRGIRQRCENPSNPAYRYYGARGIRVCDRWRVFANFFADMGERPPGMTLERINNDGNYEPGNCRWDSRSAQTRNRRGTKKYTYNGETKPLAEWADQFGIQLNTLSYRVSVGWSDERIFSKPKASSRAAPTAA